MNSSDKSILYMNNKEVITKFYTSFSNGNYKKMLECYHKDIIFEDAVFGKLKGDKAFKMWEMLLSQKKGETIINFDNVQATAESGKANWVAEYYYGDKKRKIINRVSAEFKFKDGKIIQHIDSFDLWKWTKQALGIAGLLIGWTPFIKNKIQKTTNKRLDEFINK